MGNSLAYLSLILWPFVIFFVLKKYGMHTGILVAIFCSYMLLPANFDINLPGIPAFNKGSVTVISIILYLLLTGRKLGVSSLGSFSGFILLVYVVSPFFTSFFNTEKYLYLPGMSLYDGLSQSVGNFFVIFPFVLGAAYFRRLEDQVLLFKFFVGSVLLYSILVLYEIRMSPQLHTYLYGYFPHSFAQQIRSGGFRAVVFLGHGLLVALLVSVAFMISTILLKMKIKIYNNSMLLVLIFLFAVLILSKSYTALIFGGVAFVLIYFLPSRLVSMCSVVFVVIFLSYPILSSNNIFPHSQIVNIASSFSESRSGSLAFRFYNEEQLLVHANEKPFFGWGTWGRNRVYDTESYQDTSVTDGKWIIVLGTRGWVGFLTEFYFIAISVFMAAKINRKHIISTSMERSLIAAHSLIVAFILLDQMPNASLNYFYWFFIGALYGRVDDLIKVQDHTNQKKYSC